jgi:hypothetical protein
MGRFLKDVMSTSLGSRIPIGADSSKLEDRKRQNVRSRRGNIGTETILGIADITQYDKLQCTDQVPCT